jgi:hypothetical protein
MPNPTDSNNYIGPGKLASQPGNTFPKWLYNPTLPAVIVQNWAQEVALLNQNVGWQESPSNFPPPNVQFISYANDTQAAAGGIPLGGTYFNGNFQMRRIS